MVFSKRGVHGKQFGAELLFAIQPPATCLQNDNRVIIQVGNKVIYSTGFTAFTGNKASEYFRCFIMVWLSYTSSFRDCRYNCVANNLRVNQLEQGLQLSDLLLSVATHI